jgi:hypothetical protein
MFSSFSKEENQWSRFILGPWEVGFYQWSRFYFEAWKIEQIDGRDLSENLGKFLWINSQDHSN